MDSKYTQLLGKIEEFPKVQYEPSGVLSELINAALMSLRLHRRVTQAELATAMTAAAGEPVTQAYISKVENRTARIPWDRFGQFCKCLQCTPAQVFELAEFIGDMEILPDREVAKWVIKKSALLSEAKATEVDFVGSTQ